MVTKLSLEQLVFYHVSNCSTQEDLDFDVVRSGYNWKVVPAIVTRDFHFTLPPTVINEPNGSQELLFASLLARCTYAKERNRIDLLYDCEQLSSTTNVVTKQKDE